MLAWLLPILFGLLAGTAARVLGLLAFWWVFIGLMGATIVLYDWGRRHRFRWAGEEMVQVFLGNGLCPVCLYGLYGHRVQESGVVCCAECGAHWRGERILRSEMVAQPPSAHVAELAWGRRGLWPRRRVTDDEGSPQNLLDGDFRRALAMATDAGHRGRLIEARTLLRHGSIPRRVVAWVFWLLLAGYYGRFGVAAVLSAIPPTTPSQWIQILGGLVVLSCMGLGTVAMVNPHGHGASKAATLRAMLTRLLCPACGADLSAVKKGEDDKVRCPRCRACWNGRRLEVPSALASMQSGVPAAETIVSLPLPDAGGT